MPTLMLTDNRQILIRKVHFSSGELKIYQNYISFTAYCITSSSKWKLKILNSEFMIHMIVLTFNLMFLKIHCFLKYLIAIVLRIFRLRLRFVSVSTSCNGTTHQLPCKSYSLTNVHIYNLNIDEVTLLTIALSDFLSLYQSRF